LQRIKRAIGAPDTGHRRQIRYALEGALALGTLLAGQTARERAIEVMHSILLRFPAVAL
jgi:hypothetical protein